MSFMLLNHRMMSMNGQDNESWEFDPTSLVRIIMEEQGNQIGSRTSLQKGLGLSRLQSEVVKPW
jgi:hypothetical protein